MAPAEQAALAERILRTIRPLTPSLNAALEVLSKEEGLRDATRVLFWLWRHSWGNWSAHAIQSSSALTDIPEDIEANVHGTVRLMILGPGKCPGCGKMPSNRSRRDIHRDFRWHVNCLAKAFAADAITVSQNPAVQRWAREVLDGRLVEPRMEGIQ